jgi:hypothetical protein
MSVADTSGVATLAALLAELAAGKPLRVAEFAQCNGLARSSVFDITRRLQDAGLLARDDAGRLLPGPEANALAWSAYGLGHLNGPAEAMALWLRDHADGAVSLIAGSGNSEITLLALPGPWHQARIADNLVTLTGTVLDARGIPCARIILGLLPTTDEDDKASATACLERAVATLQYHPRPNP